MNNECDVLFVNEHIIVGRLLRNFSYVKTMNNEKTAPFNTTS